MSSISVMELLLSFIITWIVVLAPPAIIRFILRRPLNKMAAITVSLILFFVNLNIFISLGSKSKSHGALIIGIFLCFYVLRWQTKKNRAQAIAEQRKAQGYDQ